MSSTTEYGVENVSLVAEGLSDITLLPTVLNPSNFTKSSSLKIGPARDFLIA